MGKNNRIMLVILSFNAITSSVAFQQSASTTRGIGTTISNHAAFLTNKQRMQQKQTELHMNFFKDLIGGAFENDQNLSKDKSLDQLEGPDDDFEVFSDNLKTDVQKRWLASQAVKPTISDSGGKGAPMNLDLLLNTSWNLSFYLTGVPNFDPSSSLYGSKVNISSRRDSTMAKDGFAIGADKLPDEASVELEIKLLEGGKCQVAESAFTSGEMGLWKLSEDGRMIRFSMDCTGYQRKVTTRGSIQNVSWSNRENTERSTSATYEIEEGQIYAEAKVGYGSQPGLFVMAESEVVGDPSAPGGLLQVEKAQGVFGVTSKMMACGKFSAQMIQKD